MINIIQIYKPLFMLLTNINNFVLAVKQMKCDRNYKSLFNMFYVLYLKFYITLQSQNIDAINTGFSNGAEIDLKIHEDFPEEKLQQVLEDFSKGKKNWWECFNM